MAADPLESLRQQIQDAATIPAPTPYVPASDPLDRLRGLLHGEPAANDDVEAAKPAVTPTAGGIEAMLGAEVLEMLREQPLSGEARAEAALRLTIALQNPSRDNLRAVLRVLVTNRVD